MVTTRKPPARESQSDRPLPSSIDAEMGVLGSILFEPSVADEVSGLLHPDDFMSPAHQTLFTRIMEIHNSGKRVDQTLLLDKLNRTKELEVVGGVPYLIEVIECTPHAANAMYYAKIVRDRSILRSLVLESNEIINEAYEGAGDAEEVVATAESRIFAISDRGVEGQQFSIQESLAGIFGSDGAPKYIAGLETGFPDLDVILGGMRPQELIILGARPSQGKTALALNITERLSMDQDKSVLFMSLEMSRGELAARLLCSRGRIDSYRFHADILNENEKRAAVKAHGEIATKAKLWIDDSPGRRVSDIAAAARRLKRKKQLDVIVVDYLQLITPDSRKEPRHEQVGAISRRLKGIAKELDVPVFCLCQLNRQAENEKPKLAHLRESGSIEQDADKVMFIYRAEKADPLIIVAKNRNGRCGEATLLWQPHFTRFENKASQRQCRNEWSEYNNYDNGLDEEF